MGGGNKGYFKDTTAREQIATKAYYVDLGTITASSTLEAVGKAWDNLTVYDKPVAVKFNYYGNFLATMLKYSDSRYGMGMAMKYDHTEIYTISVNNGTKSYSTYYDVKTTAPNHNPTLSFSNGIAELSISDIGASLIIGVMAWGGNVSLSLGIRNWVQGKYYVCNNTDPTFTGTLDVTFVYI